MECKCPNCKEPAQRHVAQRDADHPGAEYIECNECGWFECQPDGSMIDCDKPTEFSSLPAGAAAMDAVPPANKQTPSSIVPAGGGTSSPPQPADEEDEGGIEITLTDKIDY